MNNEHNPSSARIINYIVPGVVFFSIVALIAFRPWILKKTLPTQLPPGTPEIPLIQPTAIEVEPVSNLIAEYAIKGIFCLGDGAVEYAIINIRVSGGTEPYLIQVENMIGTAESPHPLPQDSEIVQIKIYAGESVRVKLWSFGRMDPDWIKVISAPASDPSCMGTLTPSPVPAPTLTPTITPTP